MLSWRSLGLHGLALALVFLSAGVLAHKPHIKTLQSRGSGSQNTQIAAAWYTGWHASDFPLTAVSWMKYTHMIYAFATTTPDVKVLSLTESDQELLPQFVSTARQHNVKALLSIGGWTGSRWYSTNVGSAANRTTFVKTVTNLVEQYNLDGIDIDWEFPGIQGIGCNIVNSNDTSNYLAFLQELRNSTVGRNMIISAATYVTPFAGPSGTPLTDVSEFAKVLDYIAIMNYDRQSNPAVGAGPSSPLNDSCAPPDARFGSAISAVKAWFSAGIPLNQTVLGVPFYGHSFDVSLPTNSDGTPTISSYPPYNPNGTKVGDRWDGDGGLDVCGVLRGPGGIYDYWSFIEEGIVSSNGSIANGIDYRFDDCSQTPFVYNSKTQTLISYENAQSIAKKGNFINSTGLAGFSAWEAGGDWNDVLLDSILNGTLHADPTITGVSAPGGVSEPGSVSGPSSSPLASSAKPRLSRTFVDMICTLGLGIITVMVVLVS